MDCFLLEGRKIVFRLALAIFKLHEDRILNMTDSVTIFMLVKEISNHIFNMDELFKVCHVNSIKNTFLKHCVGCI